MWKCDYTSLRAGLGRAATYNKKYFLKGLVRPGLRLLCFLFIYFFYFILQMEYRLYIYNGYLFRNRLNYKTTLCLCRKKTQNQEKGRININGADFLLTSLNHVLFTKVTMCVLIKKIKCSRRGLDKGKETK